MALRSIEELVSNRDLNPYSESVRRNAIAANRRLYNGDYAELNIGTVDTDIPGVAINWFQILANFYSRFSFNPRPVVTIEGNERAQEWVNDRNRLVWPVFQAAMTDALRYGYGVLTTHPLDPSQPWSMEPDSHYEVVGPDGATTHDLFVRKRSRNVSEDEQGRELQTNLNADRTTRLDIYVYGVDGTVERRVYGYASGSIGGFLRSEPLPSRAPGRQVVELSVTPQRVSLFDGVKPHVAEIGRAMTTLARGVKRNGRPHLQGPTSQLEVAEDGKKILNPDGQLLERNAGDPEWAYVQWDSNLEPVRADIDLHTEAVFATTGLSRFLFSSDNRQNIFRASATSLRRLMVPFVTRVTEMKDVSEEGYLRLLHILNQSRSSDVFPIESKDVSFYWPYEEIWQSDDPQDNDDGSDLNAQNNGGTEDDNDE